MEAGAEFTAHAPRLQQEHKGLLFLAGRHGMDLLTVKRPIIGGYRHTLAGLLPASVAAKLAMLSSFYRCAVSADVITGDKSGGAGEASKGALHGS